MTRLSEASPSAVPLSMMRRYLTAMGWEIQQSKSIEIDHLSTPATRILLEGRTGGRRNFEVYMSNISDFEDIELIIPNDIGSSEYASQVVRAIETLAILEDRSWDQVARSIREVAFDIVRSRVPDAQVFGDTIRLGVARSFVVGIRSVLGSGPIKVLAETVIG